MKQCPQCDFIYEDDQSLCDMDGRELERVHEVSPRPHAATTRPPRSSTPGRRRLPALLIAGIIFGVVLPASYYVNTSQTATVHTGHAPVGATPTSAAAPRPETTPTPESPATVPDPVPGPPATRVRPAAAAPRKRVSAAVPAAGTVRKPSPPPSAERQASAPRPEGANGKKESKLGAVLKKTGRILKKPFGF
jgi:hypothetical protein